MCSDTGGTYLAKVAQLWRHYIIVAQTIQNIPKQTSKRFATPVGFWVEYVTTKAPDSTTSIGMRYSLATWIPSPNFSPGRVKAPDFIVIHITDGQPNLDRCVERFAKRATQAAPHFVVGQDGRVVQMVDTEDRAWHCRGWNNFTLGIEHVARTPGELGPSDLGLALTDLQLEASARLVRWLCDQLGFPINRDHIRGHYECPFTTHGDCGLDGLQGGIWPWSKYMGMVQSATGAIA